jgi:hypothetical protein
MKSRTVSRSPQSGSLDIFDSRPTEYLPNVREFDVTECPDGSALVQITGVVFDTVQTLYLGHVATERRHSSGKLP